MPLHPEYTVTLSLKHLQSRAYNGIKTISTLSNMLPFMQYRQKKNMLEIYFLLFIIYKKVVSVGNKDVFTFLRMQCSVQVSA